MAYRYCDNCGEVMHGIHDGAAPVRKVCEPCGGVCAVSWSDEELSRADKILDQIYGYTYAEYLRTQPDSIEALLRRDEARRQGRRHANA